MTKMLTIKIGNDGGTGAGMLLLRAVNLIALIAACSLVIYCGYSYKQEVRSGPLLDIDTSIPVRSAKRIRPTIRSVQPLADYLVDLKKRDLFQAPWEKQKEELTPEPPIVEDSQTILQFTQSVRLVGIISDNNSRAVMEDRISGETLFLSVGDEIRGARLQEVLGDKVIFVIGSEQVELYP